MMFGPGSGDVTGSEPLTAHESYRTAVRASRGGGDSAGEDHRAIFGQRLNDLTRSPTLWPYYHTFCGSRLDPGPVGFSRSHGCSRGDPSNGATPLLDLFFRDSLCVSGRLLPSLPLSLSLCPTRAAARTSQR